MVALIFNAPPIDHEAVDLGDREWVTSVGQVLHWREMGVHHLMSVYKNARAGYVEDELLQDDLKRYIEYRLSISAVHGD